MSESTGTNSIVQKICGLASSKPRSFKNLRSTCHLYGDESLWGKDRASKQAVVIATALCDAIDLNISSTNIACREVVERIIEEAKKKMTELQKKRGVGFSDPDEQIRVALDVAYAAATSGRWTRTMARKELQAPLSRQYHGAIKVVRDMINSGNVSHDDVVDSISEFQRLFRHACLKRAYRGDLTDEVCHILLDSGGSDARSVDLAVDIINYRKTHPVSSYSRLPTVDSTTTAEDSEEKADTVDISGIATGATQEDRDEEDSKSTASHDSFDTSQEHDEQQSTETKPGNAKSAVSTGDASGAAGEGTSAATGSTGSAALTGSKPTVSSGDAPGAAGQGTLAATGSIGSTTLTGSKSPGKTKGQRRDYRLLRLATDKGIGNKWQSFCSGTDASGAKNDFVQLVVELLDADWGKAANAFFTALSSNGVKLTVANKEINFVFMKGAKILDYLKEHPDAYAPFSANRFNQGVYRERRSDGDGQAKGLGGSAVNAENRPLVRRTYGIYAGAMPNDLPEIPHFDTVDKTITHIYNDIKESLMIAVAKGLNTYAHPGWPSCWGYYGGEWSRRPGYGDYSKKLSLMLTVRLFEYYISQTDGQLDYKDELLTYEKYVADTMEQLKEQVALIYEINANTQGSKEQVDADRVDYRIRLMEDLYDSLPNDKKELPDIKAIHTAISGWKRDRNIGRDGDDDADVTPDPITPAALELFTKNVDAMYQTIKNTGAFKSELKTLRSTNGFDMGDILAKPATAQELPIMLYKGDDPLHFTAVNYGGTGDCLFRAVLRSPKPNLANILRQAHLRAAVLLRTNELWEFDYLRNEYQKFKQWLDDVPNLRVYSNYTEILNAYIAESSANKDLVRTIANLREVLGNDGRGYVCEFVGSPYYFSDEGDASVLAQLMGYNIRIYVGGRDKYTGLKSVEALSGEMFTGEHVVAKSHYVQGLVTVAPVTIVNNEGLLIQTLYAAGAGHDREVIERDQFRPPLECINVWLLSDSLQSGTGASHYVSVGLRDKTGKTHYAVDIPTDSEEKFIAWTNASLERLKVKHQ